jgi:hypothetical protein
MPRRKSFKRTTEIVEDDNDYAEDSPYKNKKLAKALPGTVFIVGDETNQANLFFKYHNELDEPLLLKSKVINYNISYKLSLPHKKLRQQQEQESMNILYDEYFQRALAKRAGKKRKRNQDDDTSDIISDLARELTTSIGPIHDVESMHEILDKQKSVELTNEIQSLFAQWSINWSDSHIGAKFVSKKSSNNILVSGYGSKSELLTKFMMQYVNSLSTCAVVLVAGYDPSVTVRDILSRSLDSLHLKVESKHESDAALIEKIHDKLTAKVKQNEDKNSGVNNDTLSPDFILQALQEKPVERTIPKRCEIFVCIHGLDGTQFQTQLAQRTLCQFASHPQVHLIGSIDRPFASLMWDSVLLAEFNFLHYWLKSTDHGYLNEGSLNTRLSESVKVAVTKSKDNVLKGLEHILKSFGNSHVKTFATVVSMIYNGKQQDKDSSGEYSLEEIQQQLEKEANRTMFVNVKTIKDQLKKMVDNELLDTKVYRGKQIYFLTKQYSKILSDVHSLVTDMAGNNVKVQKR